MLMCPYLEVTRRQTQWPPSTPWHSRARLRGF